MDEILLTTRDGIAWLELNRPARGNALSAPLVEALLECMAACVADAGIHTVVFVGAGKHFCTGFDLEDLDHASDGDLLQRFVRIEVLLDAIWRAPLRTVAIAQGRAIGAGADLWVACDHRVLAPDATLRFPGAGFGLVLGTRRLAARVGTERALDWITRSATLDAAQAIGAGLCSALSGPLPSGPLPSGPLPDGGAAHTTRTDPLADWRAACVRNHLTVDRLTYASLKAAARATEGFGASPQSDADLAALVRSASRPGLKRRLTAYRDRNTKR